MSIQLQMIGTGSAFAKKYDNNNALIRCGGVTLLIDCGITAPAALHRLDVGLDEIDGIVITHIHADHIGGLEELAFRMKYVHQQRHKLYIWEALLEPLWNYSLRGGLENPSEGLTSLHDYFHIVPLQLNKPCRLNDDLTLELFPTHHIPQKASCSILFNETLYYSSDSLIDLPLLTQLEQRGVRHLLHDCQLNEPGIVHASLQQLLQLPDSLQHKTMLMHYGDNMESFRGKTGPMQFIEQDRIYTFPLRNLQP